jgi:hypothetical protein
MSKQTKKLKNRKMDVRRRIDHRKKIIVNYDEKKEKWKKEVNNSMVHYPDYPQREGGLNYPLPAHLSYQLKILESRMFGQIDEFFLMSRYEILTQSQYSILGGGVVNNYKELQMTEEIWKNGFSNDKVDNIDFFTSHPFNILVDVCYRIHLEGLRLITGKSLMEILYLGEISVQNDLFDNIVDKEFYFGVCNKISEKLHENFELDITTLTLKDLED